MEILSFEVVSLSDMDGSGTIATEIGYLTSVRENIVVNGKFSGTVPSELGLLALDQSLVFRNQDGISGSLPSQIGMLDELHTLVAYSSSFTSSLPSELGQLNVSRTFAFAFTSIGDTIPSQLGTFSNLNGTYIF